MTILAALLLSILPHEGVLREYVDEIETNNKYCDQTGHLSFVQNIFWNHDHWNPPWRECHDWRMVKSPGQRPVFNRERGVWELIWWDGDTLRHVDARSAYETWTTHDPEVDARDRLPCDRRRKLREP